MTAVELRATRCAICGTTDNAAELYPANIDLHAFTPKVFSARRVPDRVHYRTVKCRSCGLVRSDPVADSDILTCLYQQSAFDYVDEVANLRATYGKYLAKLSKHGARKGNLLEIGCGNGFFLEEALRQGYEDVRGVEPSAAAVAQAAPNLRHFIICEIMRPGLFDAQQFDVICLFQVLDHIPDPAALLDECLALLKPGGLLLCLNHNIDSVSAKLLGEHSPIIDIEHTYLYSPTTIVRLFTAHNFSVSEVGAVYNTYTLYYLTRLIPLPLDLKQKLLGVLEITGIGKFRLSAPLGNLYIIAQKPKVNETAA